MTNEQYKTVISRMVELIDRKAPKATTAEEVEALSAAVRALGDFVKI